MTIQVSSFSVVSKLLYRAKKDVGEILSAFEFIDGSSLQAVKLISPHLMKRYFISIYCILLKSLYLILFYFNSLYFILFYFISFFKLKIIEFIMTFF